MNYKRLDELLAELYQEDHHCSIPETYMNLYGTSDDTADNWHAYAVQLSRLGLAVEVEGAAVTMQITPRGREIHRQGGWIAYLNRNAQEERLMRLEQKNESQELSIRTKEETKIIELDIVGEEANSVLTLTDLR